MEMEVFSWTEGDYRFSIEHWPSQESRQLRITLTGPRGGNSIVLKGFAVEQLKKALNNG